MDVTVDRKLPRLDLESRVDMTRRCSNQMPLCAYLNVSLLKIQIPRHRVIDLLQATCRIRIRSNGAHENSVGILIILRTATDVPKTLLQFVSWSGRGFYGPKDRRATQSHLKAQGSPAF